MTAISELLKRVREATGPDREMDALIVQAVVVPNGRVIKSPFNGEWCIYDGEHQGKPRLWEQRGGHRSEGWALTSSLDALAAFAKRVLPGWNWEIGTGGTGWSIVWPNDGDRNEHQHNGVAATPALAFLAAILSALEQREGT